MSPRPSPEPWIRTAPDHRLKLAVGEQHVFGGERKPRIVAVTDPSIVQARALFDEQDPRRMPIELMGLEPGITDLVLTYGSASEIEIVHVEVC